MMRTSTSSRSAFSLVELSIVLVILGLLTGGILTGQNLIRAAELRAVTTEFQSYQSAVMTFRDQYFALPGDMTNATDFWGAAHTTPATCPATVGTGTETCDGDGNGNLVQPAGGNQYGEMYTFWQHLANAELIEGSYDGRSAAGGAFYAAIGTTLPTSRISNSGWTAFNSDNFAGDTWWFAHDYDNALALGPIQAAAGSSYTWGQVMAPDELWNIDTKIDDGKPGMGKVMAGWYDPCTDRAAGDNTAADALAAEYDLEETGKVCGILFVDVF